MTYYKQFDERSDEKKIVDARTDGDKFFVQKREIRYAKLGINIGNETDGKKNFERPVLILSKVGAVFWVLPLTTKGKDNNPFYHRIASIDFGKPSFAMLSQIKTIDKKRLMYPLGTISHTEYADIKKSLYAFL